MPIFFICCVIFAAWLWYESKKAERENQAKIDAFWEREERANSTRKKDISHLPYCSPDMTKIPGRNHNNPEIQSVYEDLTELSKLTMLDLEGQTNTDLKLNYGVGNFNELTSFDDNYNKFLVRLSILARRFEEESDYDSAIACYEYAISFGSKRLSDFENLAKAFLKKDEPEKVSDLISKLSGREDIERRQSIIDSLRTILGTYV